MEVVKHLSRFLSARGVSSRRDIAVILELNGQTASVEGRNPRIDLGARDRWVGVFHYDVMALDAALLKQGGEKRIADGVFGGKRVVFQPRIKELTESIEDCREGHISRLTSRFRRAPLAARRF